VTAAITYLADLGSEFGAPFAEQSPGFEGRRLHLKTAMMAVRAYERPLAERLGDEGIFVWNGNYYALAVTERLGVEESGGMVRVGIAHYNTEAEVERLLAAVDDLARL
jgi:selenocysteine lyase/cysteine desulfurase